MHNYSYKAPMREIDFVLWEQMQIQKTLGVSSPEDRAAIESVVELARDFAEGPMAAAYAESDREEAYLDADGVVRTPPSYASLMKRYREIWTSWRSLGDDGRRPLPEIVEGLVIEMMVGSNPSFVTYVGFNGPALTLLETYGSEELRRQFGPALEDLSATACLCLTEKAAGSDLNLIACAAEKQSAGIYHLSGHKWLISAGMHELSDNIYYFILARVGEGAGMLGLSCFLVPRYRLDSSGRPTIDNGVRCRRVVQKMGLRGCANTHLEFGDEVPTVAYLLGANEGHGLQQLMLMMTPARISTGIYALGLASSACETAKSYSEHRIQGKQFDQSMSGKAASLPIKMHADVRRMRLDMVSTTMGCRALIARLGLCRALVRGNSLSPERIHIEKDLLEVLLPIVKAYTSDQAWRVTGSAIQTMGGVGYLRENPVEQNARDCKILSIWEGTNHIQSLFLIRDKLGMCLRSSRLESLFGEIDATLAALAKIADFAVEIGTVEEAKLTLLEVCRRMGMAVRQAEMNRLPEFSCEFLAALAEIAIAWQLLDGARVATQASAQRHSAADDEYYQEKIEAARYFIRRRLPLSCASLVAIARELGDRNAAPVRLPGKKNVDDAATTKAAPVATDA